MTALLSSRDLRRPLIRYLWASPLTLLGLVLGAFALLLGATAKRHDGVLEIASRHTDNLRRRSRWLKRQPFVAITLGHVILGRDHAVLAQWRSHEHIHVAQTERWGLLFPVVYGMASAWALARGQHPYWDNHFERLARGCGPHH